MSQKSFVLKLTANVKGCHGSHDVEIEVMLTMENGQLAIKPSPWGQNWELMEGRGPSCQEELTIFDVNVFEG